MGQDGSYPGTGKFDEVGTGAGEGATLNLPLPGGSGDTTMRTVFDEVIAPCAQRFKPDIILVSAGWVFFITILLELKIKLKTTRLLVTFMLTYLVNYWFIVEFLVVSFVRYDAHVLDPLANLQYTTGTYYMLASSIKQLAKDLCGGRCVFFLEGGYNLKSLSYSVADSFRALLGDRSLAPELDNPNILYEEPSTKVKQAIQRIKSIHSLWFGKC